MRYVLGDMRREQTVTVPERNEQLDPGLVQSRRTHQPDRVDVVRHGHHQAPFARNDEIRSRAVRVVRFIRRMVKTFVPNNDGSRDRLYHYARAHRIWRSEGRL